MQIIDLGTILNFDFMKYKTHTFNFTILEQMELKCPKYVTGTSSEAVDGDADDDDEGDDDDDLMMMMII